MNSSSSLTRQNLPAIRHSSCSTTGAAGSEFRPFHQGALDSGASELPHAHAGYMVVRILNSARRNDALCLDRDVETGTWWLALTSGVKVQRTPWWACGSTGRFAARLLVDRMCRRGGCSGSGTAMRRGLQCSVGEHALESAEEARRRGRAVAVTGKFDTVDVKTLIVAQPQLSIEGFDTCTELLVQGADGDEQAPAEVGPAGGLSTLRPERRGGGPQPAAAPRLGARDANC